MLGLYLDVPARRLRVRPHVPEAWGRVVLGGLDLGGSAARLKARGDAAVIEGLATDCTAEVAAPTDLLQAEAG